MTASPAGLAFDRVADRYDALWSETAIGRQQRLAVWQCADRLFARGSRVLDFGCGSGVDAVHLMQAGVEVVGIDASAEMVRLARARGVNARRLDIEELDGIDGLFDGALSDFGALNCVSDLMPVARSLGRLIRSGGHTALCVLGRSCVWEMAHFLRRGHWAKAFRRYRRGGCASSLGVRVYYHSAEQIRRAFAPQFHLVDWRGIGVCVPPSYVSSLSARAIGRAASMDRRLARLPLLRGLGDHRLFVFRRI